MRVLELVAHAFGPFRDRKFTFAPGFTLVHGANEAGKSSLHAALCAGMCGVRRGKGRSAVEQEFERRHRPWVGTGWKVSVLLELEDGQRVELSQDFDDKAQCKAIDAVRGRDLTSRIENEGTPDAAKFLGLDRNAFLATACVRQAELLAVRDNPAALQEHLQRGVDTSGTDATAAEALEHIDAFLREQIGSRQVHSTKPLRRAQVRVADATQVLARAQADHAGYRALLGREDAFARDLDKAQRDLELTQASLALAEVGARRRELERARELVHRHGETPPPTLVEDEERTVVVERALHGYATRPALPHLEGAASAVLRRELQALESELASWWRAPLDDASARDAGAHDAGTGRQGDPQAPGDRYPAARPSAPHAPVSPRPASLEREAIAVATHAAQTGARPTSRAGSQESQPAAEVLEAAAQVRGLRHQLEEHRAERPAQPGPLPGSGLTAFELHELANVLSRPEPAADQRLETRRRQLDLQWVRARRAGRRLLGVAIACGVAGAPLAIAGALGHAGLVAGIVLLVAAAVLAFASLRRSGSGAQVMAQDEMREVEASLATLRVRHDDWLHAREEALRAARRRELVADPRQLRDQAAAREAWDRTIARLAAWDDAQARLQRQAEFRTAELRALLHERDVPASADVLADLGAYQQRCTTLARRRQLEVRIAERERDEAARERGAAQCEAAETQLLQAARQCGIRSEDLEICRAALETWRTARRRRLESQEQARREWTELERLLGGRPLATCEAALAEAEERARSLAALFSPQEILGTECDETARGRNTKRVRDAELALATLRGEIAQYGMAAPRVSEAEEELAAATREVERLQQLEATLQAARDLLQRAQERVHLNVAPRLAAAILPVLPAVTAGRYDEVLVDPETLDVKVRPRGGEWREAALLSHGTAEQIYLLLRVAMVRQLVRRGEIAPLLFDDVTVHFDRERKHAMLDTLYALSATQQVILSTQEEDVLAWARQHLTGPRDAVLDLGV